MIKKITLLVLLPFFLAVVIRNHFFSEDNKPLNTSEKSIVPTGIPKLPTGPYKVIRYISRKPDEINQDCVRVIIELEDMTRTEDKIQYVEWSQPIKIPDIFTIGEIFNKESDGSTSHRSP